MKEYDYFLFDWDGCLAKTLEVWLEAYKSSLAKFGAYPTDAEISHHLGDWSLPKYFGVVDYAQCNDDALEIAKENLRQVALYEGAKDLLLSLSGRKKLALLSSSSKETLFNGLAYNGVADCFDVIFSGHDVTHHKPHPEVIEKGLAALSGVKDKAVMIGDSRKDLGAAQNAQIDSVLIYPYAHKIFYNLDELKRYNPTYIFHSLREFKEELERGQATATLAV